MKNYFFQKKRTPPLLMILSILTLISTSLTLLGGVASILFGPSKEKQSLTLAYKLPNDANPDLIDSLEQLDVFLGAINEHFYFYNFASLIIASIGILAVQKMLSGKSLGFHLYIIYSIISIAQYYILIPISEIPSFYINANLAFSVFYIFLYSLNLKWMNNQMENENPF